MKLLLSDPKTETPVPLWCQKISKWHGKVLALNQVSLELRPGITALLGTNGAGKSTLLNIISGLLRPSIGSVHVFGVDPWTPSGKSLVGYSPDHDYFPVGATVQGFLSQMAMISGMSKKESDLRIFELLEMLSLLDLVDFPIRKCSLGNRQRIKLARSLLPDPPLLILDEPFRGIDPLGRRDLINVLKKLKAQGKTILLSSHELSEVEKLTDRIVLMRAGRIICAGPMHLARQSLENMETGLLVELSTFEEMILFVKEVLDLHGNLLTGVRFLPESFRVVLGISNAEKVLGWVGERVASGELEVIKMEILEEAESGKGLNALFRTGMSQ